MNNSKASVIPLQAGKKSISTKLSQKSNCRTPRKHNVILLEK